MISHNNIKLVCPKCREGLEKDGTHAFFCPFCNTHYPPTHEGFINLLITGEFEDAEDIGRGLREEIGQATCVKGYLIPLLKRCFRDREPETVSILDLGCGVGNSIDILKDGGYDAWGADSGHRRNMWTRRKYPENLILCAGEALPFESNCFDFIFCGGVIEHIGCIGDARVPSPGYIEKRLAFIRESVRVVRRGGFLNYACPNRLFPFDLFHRTDEMNPFRFHYPWDPFLLSIWDFKYFFIDQCGCRSLDPVPAKNYWGFNRMLKTAAGRMGCKAADIWFSTFGTWAGFRGSPLNPWLSVLVRK